MLLLSGQGAGLEDGKAAFGNLLAFVKTMHEAGVSVALGNDAGTPNVPFGWGMHHEMQMYVEADLTPMDAIVAATATDAAQMPPVGEADFGTLKAGEVADLIVLIADPLADIRNTLRCAAPAPSPAPCRCRGRPRPRSTDAGTPAYGPCAPPTRRYDVDAIVGRQSA